jgi:hypothetical protein
MDCSFEDYVLHPKIVIDAQKLSIKITGLLLDLECSVNLLFLIRI